MKKLILAAIAFTSVVTANAQAEVKVSDTTAVVNTNAPKEVKPSDTTTVAKVVTNNENDQRKEIKIEELPAAIQTALKTDQFKGWNAKSAYVVKGTTPYYEVELVNAKTEKNVVKFNENGTVID